MKPLLPGRMPNDVALARPRAPFLVEPPPSERAPAPSSEPDLTDRALAGDVAAWNALVQKHNHRVVVSLLARGIGMDRAKDIAQDAWIKLIEKQREGKLTQLVLPGLAVTQAAFLALEEARRTRRTEASPDPESFNLADPGANAESRLMAEESLEQAETVLASCSPSAKKVFRLVYGGDGLSHAEVASQVGLSLQRVRQIVCEVRKLLRAAIIEEVEP